MLKRPYAYTFFVLLFLIACQAPNSPDLAKASIVGFVEDSQGNLLADIPINLAFATGQSYQTRSSISGGFTFTTLDQGMFTLSANYEDFSGSLSDNLTADELGVTLTLYRKGKGEISGSIHTSNNQSAKNTTVTLNFAETNYSASTLSDASGAFIFKDLPLDGTFAISAYQSSTGGFGSTASFLTASQVKTNLSIDLTIPSPESTNETFENPSFEAGTLQGWTLTGNAQIVDRQTFTPQISDLSPQAVKDNPYVALITTKGDSVGVGRIEQTFKVLEGQTTITGAARFVSNEYPEWYGSEYNDYYQIKINGTVIAKSNLNSSSWFTSGPRYGFNASTPEIPLIIDVSDYVDQVITLTIEVFDVGDLLVSSGIAVTLDASNANILDEIAIGIPKTITWVLPDDFLPSDLTTPVARQRDEGLVILARDRDIKNNLVTVAIPVQSYSGAGFGLATPQPIPLSSLFNIKFSNLDSTPTKFINGTAKIRVEIPVNKGASLLISPADLEDLETGNRNAESIDVNSTFSTTEGEKAIVETLSLGYGKNVAYWFDDLSSTSLTSQQLSGGEIAWEVTKFAYDLIPIVGDGTDVVVQSYYVIFDENQFDWPLSAIAAIGLSLDLTGVGNVAAPFSSSLKAIYKVSRAGKGIIADATKVSLDAFRKGNLSARQTYETLKAQFGTLASLYTSGGKALIEKFDDVAEQLIQATGKDLVKATDEVDKALAYAKTKGIDGTDYLDLAKTTSSNIDKVSLNQIADWLASGRLKKVGEGVFESAEGLRYSINNAPEGHRIAHILKHNADDPSRTVHGVFTGDSLTIIDNAWKKRTSQYQVPRTDGRIQYNIPSTNPGYVGGQVTNKPLADHVTIIVNSDGQTIVTAFPFKK